jgi:hypothetical protein
VLGVDEPSRTLLLKHREISELNRYLPFRQDSVLHEVAVNKIEFQKWCNNLGIDCPRSVYVNDANAVADAAKQFSYPFILKGALGAGGMCVDRIDSSEDLKSVLEQNSGRGEWIVQEFVDGQVGTTGFVAGREGLYALCSVTNLVCMGDGFGPSQIGCFVRDQRLREITEKMTSQGGVYGMTGFDWIKTSTGEYKVIDPHFGRVVPNMVVAHLDGVDWGEAYADYITNQPAQLREGRGAEIVYWLFPQSLQLFFEGRLWQTLKNYPPWKRHVRLFFAGKNEWRMFFSQSLEFIFGRARVVLGAVRKCFRR